MSGRANLLAGVQLQPGQLLSGHDAAALAGVAQELRRPLSRPADDHNHAFARPLQVEVRPDVAAGPAGGRGETLFLAGRQDRLHGLEVIGPDERPLVMVQHEVALGVALEARVQGLDVGEDRRVAAPVFLK